MAVTPVTSILTIPTTKEDVSSHRRSGSNGNGSGGVPDWFYWLLVLVVLTIGALIFMFGDRI